MLDDTAQRSRVSFFGRSYFEGLLQITPRIAHLSIAEVNGQPAAAALVYDWQDTRYYAHAAAFQELNRQSKASVSLVWHLIMEAKSAGLRWFDFWGVAPEGAPAGHRLAGVTRFKLAFGGQRVNYVGTWDIPLRAGKYRAYQLYRRLRGLS
jgi:lipid II:glycine glycyltransferase (peptidoglycan interpeptide bridge formation enzyme)